jgi:hypothetical protein
VRLIWNAALDCNGNAVSGYNIYRANSPAGPYSKINTALITATEYVDSAGSIGIADSQGGSGDSYYAVSSVDGSGDESAQSLGISPAAIAAASGGGGAGAACFVQSVAQSGSCRVIWMLAVLSIILVIAAGIRRQASGTKAKQRIGFGVQRSKVQGFPLKGQRASP